MSFNKLKAEDLLFVAQNDLGLEVAPDANTKQVLAAITEAKIKWADAVELSPTVAAVQDAIDEEKAAKAREASQAAVVTTSSVKQEVVAEVPVSVLPVPAEDGGVLVVEDDTRPSKVLIRMERENPTYNVRGYKFTYDHPFCLVSEVDAEYLTSNIEGFYYATPKEAAEFYE